MNTLTGSLLVFAGIVVAVGVAVAKDGWHISIFVVAVAVSVGYVMVWGVP